MVNLFVLRPPKRTDMGKPTLRPYRADDGSQYKMNPRNLFAR